MGKRVTILEAVEITGLSEYAIRTGIKQGRYPHIRVGAGNGKILLDVGLFEDYLYREAVSNVNIHNNHKNEEIHYGVLRRVEC